MALYPSLEDLKVGQMMQAQTAPLAPSYPIDAYAPNYSNGASAPPAYDSSPNAQQQLQNAYPALFDMGLALTEQEIAMITANQVAIPAPSQVQTIPQLGALTAPISGNSLGLQRAQVTHGVREVVLCKGPNGKAGLRVQAISKGVFVVFVQKSSPASMVGLRFGDQILQIGGENVAGYSVDKVHTIIKKGPANGIRLAVRDRPFERTVTLHKDSVGHVGFSYKNGRINGIVKESSAARNGVLIDHNILEVNGQNVVGLNDKESGKLIEQGGPVVTFTLIPSFVYDHLMKHMATSLVKKLMDHSVPDL